MSKLNSLADFPGIKVGDTIVAPLLERRKWWQFWKPKYGPMRMGTCRVTDVSYSTISLED